MRQYPPHINERGFTLMETLVALAVIAVLTTSGTVLLLSTLRGSQQVEQRTETIRALSLAQTLLADDMAAMTDRRSRSLVPGDRPQGFVGVGGDEGGALFTFVRNSWTNPGGEDARSNLMRVEYYFEAGRFFRLAYLAPDPLETTPVVEQTLAMHLERVQIRYSRGGEWSDVWISPGLNTSNALPELVELTWYMSGGEILRQVFPAGGRS